MYTRFVKFLDFILKSKKPQVQALLKISNTDVRSTTGANLRDILLNTGIKVTPGVSSMFQLKEYVVYSPPEEEQWKLPLIESLIEIRDGRWEVIFDEEDTNGVLTNDDVTTMIDGLCIN